MAVAHDGEANVTANATTAVASITASGKTTAGSNRYGVVCAYVRNPATTATATWDSVSMGSPVAHHANPTDGRQTYIWGIIAPPTGATDIVVTMGTADSQGVVVVSSYSGVDQSTPVDAEVTASGTADPATLDVSSAVGDMVVDCLYFLGAATAPSVGADQVENGNDDDGGIFGASSREAGAATVTMSWTLTTPTRWTQVAVNMNQAAAGAAVSIVPVIRQNYRNMGYS